MRKGNKADILKCLDVHAESTKEIPEVIAKIVDGAVLVQMTPPRDVKTFGYYAKTLSEKVRKGSNDADLTRINIVFDRYFKQSLKSQTREKRRSGVRI